MIDVEDPLVCADAAVCGIVAVDAADANAEIRPIQRTSEPTTSPPFTRLGAEFGAGSAGEPNWCIATRVK